jgi:serine-type D-Ala-D-Ala carboxypeptidase/endopeptidase
MQRRNKWSKFCLILSTFALVEGCGKEPQFEGRIFKTAQMFRSGQTNHSAQTYRSGDLDGLTRSIERHKTLGLLKRFSVRTYEQKSNSALYEHNFGKFEEEKPVPIASSAKWLTAAVVLGVVEQGKLSLDSTTEQVLGWSGNKGNITLAQALSLTSGLPDLWNLKSCVSPKSTLQTCAESVFEGSPLISEPGTKFRYGPTHLQIAAAMAEKASGKSWAELSEQVLFEPLQMPNTFFYSYGDETPTRAKTNPGVAGAAVSTTQDYLHFLSMLANDGLFRGKQVLQKKTIEKLFQNKTNSVKKPVLNLPRTIAMFQSFNYALGNWVECESRECDSSSPHSSLGSGGWYPWVDQKAGYYGLISTLQNPANVALELRGAQKLFAIQGEVSKAMRELLKKP